jgi:5-methylcytosine-specific restriction endonuclease McrA
MFAYCVGELHLSEDAAFKRITAARMARRFPVIFEALAEGRLHLTAISLLSPHLTEDTAEELLAASSHKSKAEIELLLAKRFPRSDMLAWVAAVPAAGPGLPSEPHAPGHVEAPSPSAVPVQLAPERVDEHPRVTPLSPQSFAIQFTMSQEGYDDLRHAQALLAHQVPSGDIAQIFERALKALIPQLEKQKFAATDSPRRGHGRPSTNPRDIPARVRRAVWKRDGGQCTFVSEDGHRCEARKPLEFDHIQEVARGGEATVDGIRLRCRAHNQYQAECTFGAEFMRHKRTASAEARACGHRLPSAVP